MPTDRVLIEIVTAANMAGVEQAKTGMLGLNASTLALGASLGALIFVGKSAIENTEAQEKAHKSLAQAAAVGKLSFDNLQTAFDRWAEANKRYIPDQYAAEEALAAFVRAGASAPDAMRELNDALDLSTLRSMSLEDAQKQITLALTGSSKALKVLGITSEEYSAIMKDKHLTVEQKHLALLALIEGKTKDGRKAQTDLTQSTQAMNKDWQDITTKIGPPLLQLLTFIADKADDLVSALKNLGDNKDWNRALYVGLGQIQNFIVNIVQGVRELIDGIKWLASHPLVTTGGSQNLSLGSGSGHRAGGGPVSAGGVYTVGERGPETLVMGGNGYVVPNGGGGGRIGNAVNHLHIHVDQGAYIDGPSIDRLANLILQRARFAPGT